MSSIRKELIEIRERIKYDCAFSNEDLEALLFLHPFAGLDIVGLWIYGNRINPSLSFDYHGASDKTCTFGVSAKVLTSYSLKKGVEDLRLSENVISTNNYAIYSKGVKNNREAFELLLDCCSIIARNSINSVNVTLSQFSRINHMVSKKVGPEKKDNYEKLLSDCTCEFSKFIRQHSLVIKLDSDENIDVVSRCIVPDKSTIGLGRMEPSCIDISLLLRALEEKIVVTLDNGEEGLIAVVPITVGGEMEIAQYYCLFFSESILRKYDVFMISQFGKAFESEYKQMKRVQLLAGIQHRVDVEEKALGRNAIKKSFEEYFRSHCIDIFSIISCHSITIRLFNPSVNKLDVYTTVQSPTGGKPSKTELEDKGIPINRYADSVNAFTYLIASKKLEYVYIRNFNKPVPKNYSDIGLRGVRHSRTHSRSEVCLPFRFRNTVIGTMNVESSIASAFDNDIELMLSIKNSLESRYQSYFESLDVDWHKRLTKFADPLHELKNYLETSVFDERQAALLNSLFFQDDKKNSDEESRSLFKVKRDFEDWILDFYSKETDDIVRDVMLITEFNLTHDIEIPQTIYTTIMSVLKNLIKNIEDHSDIRKDKVIVSNTVRNITAKELSSEKSDAVMRIRLKTFGLIEQRFLDAMCVKPIFKQDTKHFGLYSLGLQVRSVGGYVFASSDPDGYPTVLEFHIPIAGDEK